MTKSIEALAKLDNTVTVRDRDTTKQRRMKVTGSTKVANDQL